MEAIDIQKFRGGDEEVFKNIVETYSERIFNIIFRMVRNIDDSEDIVQETFTRAFMKRRTFKGKSSVYTWLVRIAYNITLNRLKKTRPMTQLDPRMASDSDPEDDIQRKELAEKIAAAIQELPPRQRMVFSLRFHDRMQYKEISKLMNCKEGTAKALYHFAIEKLSSKLGDLNPQRGKNREQNVNSIKNGQMPNVINN